VSIPDTITDALVADLDGLHFGPPVTHVYNPLVYARAPWDRYCQTYGEGRREVLLVGMNPGPWGMAQVGVPFGEVHLVREFLGIDAAVGKPANEHPKRPIQGFACARNEVSGTRFWGWVRDRFGTPERFFARFFVVAYCPLAFMEQSGRNLTPDKLRPSERLPLHAACDRALLRTIAHFQPKFLIGIGNYAGARIRAVTGDVPGVAVGSIPHPSPASPLANRGWAPLVEPALAQLGVSLA
jgi:single-strand selective monofunctional uracil DNA glycosylase